MPSPQQTQPKNNEHRKKKGKKEASRPYTKERYNSHIRSSCAKCQENKVIMILLTHFNAEKAFSFVRSTPMYTHTFSHKQFWFDFNAFTLTNALALSVYHSFTVDELLRIRFAGCCCSSCCYVWMCVFFFACCSQALTHIFMVANIFTLFAPSLTLFFQFLFLFFAFWDVEIKWRWCAASRVGKQQNHRTKSLAAAAFSPL